MPESSRGLSPRSGDTPGTTTENPFRALNDNSQPVKTRKLSREKVRASFYYTVGQSGSDRRVCSQSELSWKAPRAAMFIAT
jgi:hypothetical protein